MIGGLILSLENKESENGFHPLKDVNGINALLRTIITFQQCGIYPIVVLSSVMPDTWQSISKLGVAFMGPNEEEHDLSPYLTNAIGMIRSQTSKLLITSSSYPLIRSETITKMLQIESLPGRPCYHGFPGFPIAIGLEKDATDFTYTMEMLSSILLETPCSFATSDMGVAYDLSQKVDWKNAFASFSAPSIRPALKLTLAREQVFFGPGTYYLLESILNTGSVKKACHLMGISYSKGWKMIHLAESEFGYKLVITKKGGEKGGRSTLSAFGLNLIKDYQDYVIECSASIKTSFEKYFSKYNLGE